MARRYFEARVLGAVAPRLVAALLTLTACSNEPGLTLGVGGEDGGLPCTEDGSCRPTGGTTPGCTGCVDDACTVASCDGLSCTRRDRADGTACTGGICVAGTCGASACGDGYVRAAALEICDDGNTSAGDGCSSTCQPERVTVAERPAGDAGPAGVDETFGSRATVGVDGRGIALITWLAQVGDTRQIRARRFGELGAPLDPVTAPLVIATVAGLGTELTWSVAGRDEGWVVAYSAVGADSDGLGVRALTVRTDGTLAASFAVAAEDPSDGVPAGSFEHGDQVQPTAIAAGTAIVVAWVDRGLPAETGEVGQVRLRSLTTTGGPAGAIETLSPPERVSSEPVLVPTLDGYAIAWVESAAGSETFEARVVMRRRGTDWLDATPVVVEQGRVSTPALALLDSGEIGAAWLSRALDARGNVHTAKLRAIGALFASSVTVHAPATSGRQLGQWRPVIGAAAQGRFVTGWDQDERAPRSAVVDVESAVAAPDLSRLTQWLSSGAATGISLARAPRGIWSVWSEPIVGGRAVRAHLLPYPDACRSCGGETPYCHGATGECFACRAAADCPSWVGSSAECVTEECVYSCLPGRGDCDADPRTCEVDLTDDIDNCGACGTSCVGLDNTESTDCTAGTCEMICSTHRADCDGAWENGCEVSTDYDFANCGGCGIECGPGELCDAGTCICDTGYAECPGEEECSWIVDDPDRCGELCTDCSALPGVLPSATCKDAACDISCASGRQDCDSQWDTGCEVNALTDAANCGACGDSCSGHPYSTGGSCVGGECGLTCVAGRRNCDEDRYNGCESISATDPYNCGGCLNSCVGTANSSGGTCSASTCSITCNASFGNCDTQAFNGCEVNLKSTAQHCGACNYTCLGRAHTSPLGTGACVNSQCQFTCEAGWGNCDTLGHTGCETSLVGNAANCGSCGYSCLNKPHATSGSCQSSGNCLFTCATGYRDCDGQDANGCEIDSVTNAQHCGACNNSCLNKANTTGGTCSASTCSLTCASTHRNCDTSIANGCETPRTSNLHCGSCGNNCTNGANSSGGSCINVFGSYACALTCDPGFADCDGITSNGCEVNLNTSRSHCGSCGNACGTYLFCISGSCRLF